MRLLSSQTDYIEAIIAQLQTKPKQICVATFGLYAGIDQFGRDVTAGGKRFVSYTRRMLDLMSDIDKVQILIGLPKYSGCNGIHRCLNCEKKFVSGLIRLLNHVETFPKFEWRAAQRIHLKCVITPSQAIIGGRNFTDSDWADMSFQVAGKIVEQIQTHFDEVWDNTTILDGALVEDVLRISGISEGAVMGLL